MGVDPSVLVTLLNPLEADGYVSRQRDPADRRRHVVALSPAGATHLAAAAGAQRAAEDELFAGLDQDQREQLRQLLLALQASHHRPAQLLHPTSSRPVLTSRPQAARATSQFPLPGGTASAVEGRSLVLELEGPVEEAPQGELSPQSVPLSQRSTKLGDATGDREEPS